MCFMCARITLGCCFFFCSSLSMLMRTCGHVYTRLPCATRNSYRHNRSEPSPFCLSIMLSLPRACQERKTQLAKAAWMGEQVGDAAAEAAAAGNSRRLLQQQQGGQMGVRADDIRQLMGLA